MALSKYFPTFERAMYGTWAPAKRAFYGAWMVSPWKSTPPWPADSVASEQKALLHLLAAAAENRLEAAPLIMTLAAEHRGSYRRRLRRLARRLEAGTLLADALEQTPGVLSDDQALAVRFGDQSGTLPATLEGLLNHPSQAEFRVVARLREIGSYVTIVALVFFVIMAFYLVKIIPSFVAIFSDFELQLPHITILLIRLANVVVNYWILFAIPLIVVGWLIRSRASRRFFSRNVSSRILRPIAQLRVANVLSLLAANSRAGRPTAGAISTLARYHFDPRIRHKLLFVRNEMEQGASVWDSMADAKLLSGPEAHALEKATSSESRAWTMDKLADKRRGQVEHRIDFYVSLLQPIITLLLASVVLFVAVACLVPVFKLTEALTG